MLCSFWPQPIFFSVPVCGVIFLPLYLCVNYCAFGKVHFNWIWLGSLPFSRRTWNMLSIIPIDEQFPLCSFKFLTRPFNHSISVVSFVWNFHQINTIALYFSTRMFSIKIIRWLYDWCRKAQINWSKEIRMKRMARKQLLCTSIIMVFSRIMCRMKSMDVIYGFHLGSATLMHGPLSSNFKLWF